MKKIFYILAIAAATLLASCQKDPIGGTAVQEMSGQWYVTCDLMSADGEVVYTGSEALGLDDRFVILTYNNTSNKNNELMVDDLESFWKFKCVTACDLKALTFSCKDAEDILNGDTVTMTGKIVKNGTETPSKQKADYIEINVTFGKDTLPAKYGYDHYRLSGWRYTGFTNDD